MGKEAGPGKVGPSSFFCSTDNSSKGFFLKWRTKLLKLQSAYVSPGDFVKMQIVVKGVWGRA